MDGIEDLVGLAAFLVLARLERGCECEIVAHVLADVRFLALADRMEAMLGASRSTPVARKSCNPKSVGNQSGASTRGHDPLRSWRAIHSAARPSFDTRARSASIPAGGASMRSRIACQRMAGSESGARSQSIGDMRPFSDVTRG